MFATLSSIAAFLVIVLALLALGAPWAKRLVPTGRAERMTWALAIGGAFASMIALGLGLVGLFTPHVLIGLTIPAAVVGLIQLPRWLQLPKPLSNDRWPWIDRAVITLAGFGVALSFVSALAPPTAGDAMCYHLQLAKEFLLHGGLPYLPESEESTYPLVQELAYSWGLALGDAVTAQLMAWLSGVLLIGATYVLANLLSTKRVARLSAATLALVPAISNPMSAPLNDLAVAAFCTLTLASAVNAFRLGHVRWFVLGGLMLGTALGIKYNALLFASGLTVYGVIMLASGVWQNRNRQEAETSTSAERTWKGCFTQIALTVVISAIVAAPWYGRALYHTGNPVYPYLSSVFGSDGPPVLRSSKRPLDWTAADVLSAPWQLTMTPESFGGRSHQLGILFLALLPGVILIRRPSELVPVLLVAGVYALAWFGLKQNIRFLLPVVPILAIACMIVWQQMAHVPRIGWAFACVLVGVTLFHSAISMKRAMPNVSVAMGLETRDAFLARHEPVWSIAKVAGECLPPDARVLSQEMRLFWFPRPAAREAILRRKLGWQMEYDAWLADAKQIGFTHLLLAAALDDVAPQYDSTLSDWAERNPQQCRLVAEAMGQDTEGGRRRYRLMKLIDTPDVVAERVDISNPPR
jgi:hypothetical protein